MWQFFRLQTVLTTYVNCTERIILCKCSSSILQTPCAVIEQHTGNKEQCFHVMQCNTPYQLLQKSAGRWENERKVCAKFLVDSVAGGHNLGAEVMREYLVVFDVENQSVRWNSNL